jgi:myo-inositol-1-phosphate synthase
MMVATSTTEATADTATFTLSNCHISGTPALFPAVEVSSENVAAETADHRIFRYSSKATSVKRAADGSLRVFPRQREYLLQVPTTRPAKVGLLLVGWGGNNGSTLTAALAAHRLGTSWKSRRGPEQANFNGSLVMASTVALGYDEDTGKEAFAPMYQLAPFVDPKNLAIGGWDISSMDIASACDRACVLEPTLIDALRSTLQDAKPMASIYDPAFIASNQSDRADNTIPGSRRAKIEQIRKDIRYTRAALKDSRPNSLFVATSRSSTR